MKTALIIIGVIVLIIACVFLYLLVAGVNESRRRCFNSPKEKDDNEENINGM